MLIFLDFNLEFPFIHYENFFENICKENMFTNFFFRKQFSENLYYLHMYHFFFFFAQNSYREKYIDSIIFSLNA